MNKTPTTYRVIGFGHTDYGFFNQPNFCSTFESAMGFYKNHVCDPEMDGAVLIKVNHEDWCVIEEFGTEGYSVVYGPVGNFKVTKAANIVLL